MEMLKAAAKIPHVSGIELVGDWDIRPDNVNEMCHAFKDYGMKCVSIIPIFSETRSIPRQLLKLRCGGSAACGGSRPCHV